MDEQELINFLRTRLSMELVQEEQYQDGVGFYKPKPTICLWLGGELLSQVTLP